MKGDVVPVQTKDKGCILFCYEERLQQWKAMIDQGNISDEAWIKIVFLLKQHNYDPITIIPLLSTMDCFDNIVIKQFPYLLSCNRYPRSSGDAQ